MGVHSVTRTLTTLPQELQLQIISHLQYPDKLSLKLTSHHYHAITTPQLTTKSRVDWLLDRARMRLPIPRSQGTDFNTDAAFLQSSDIQRFLRARRTHAECLQTWRKLDKRRSWSGCLVFSDTSAWSDEVEEKGEREEKASVWMCNGERVWRSKMGVYWWSWIELRMREIWMAYRHNRYLRLMASMSRGRGPRMPAELWRLVLQIALGIILVALARRFFGAYDEWLFLSW